MLVRDKNFKVYIKAEDIKSRVKDMAHQIDQDFGDKNPVIISILNGAFIFTADLFRELETDAEVSFVKVKSYEGESSSGKVKTFIGLDKEISGRDVILLDDIIDTGLTFKFLLKELEMMSPSSIKTCCLLFKKSAFKEEFSIDYYGFEIEDKFVIGYGLDYNEKGRNLESIYQLSE